MAVPRSKRKRLLILSSLLSQRLQDAFDNNSEDAIAQEGLVYCAAVMPQMLLESDENWSNEQDAAYDAVDSFVTHIETSVGEPDFDTYVAALGAAVAQL